MKVVAFLQNPWFKPETPNYIIAKYRDDPDFRRKVLSLSVTGRRLDSAYGKFFSQIHWNNANPLHGSYSSKLFREDIGHMVNVLGSERPVAVVTYAKTALDGMSQILHYWDEIPEIKALDLAKPAHHHCPHPNSRGITQHQLNEFAREIIERYLTDL